jgi:hypothetical protein
LIEDLLTSADALGDRFDNDGENSLSERSVALALDHKHGQMEEPRNLKTPCQGLLAMFP